jgi:putative transcriptional regulator
MIRHVAPDELLLDYASGALPEGPSLAIAVHLSLCEEARARAAALERLGGELLHDLPPADMAEGALEDVLARLGAPEPLAPPVADAFSALPKPLHPYLPPGTTWRKPWFGPTEIVLPTQNPRHMALLLSIEPGGGIPKHVHEGVELTAVISGSFNDGFEDYAAGDLAMASGIEHTPIATGTETCVCLVVYQRPIIFSGTFSRIVNLRRWWRFRV